MRKFDLPTALAAQATAAARVEALRRKRYQRTLVLLKQWRTKLKRAKTKVAKLERTALYYSRLGAGKEA